MFWNTFYELCRKNNTYPLTVVKETGIATGSITKWKNGTVPSGATLQKLAATIFIFPQNSIMNCYETHFCNLLPRFVTIFYGFLEPF